MPTGLNDSTPSPRKNTRRMARQPAPCADVRGAEHAEEAAAPLQTTKRDLVLALLRQEGGASLAEIAQATGWLPHSTRAPLTGLRKKGHAIESRRIGRLTTYVLA